MSKIETVFGLRDNGNETVWQWLIKGPDGEASEETRKEDDEDDLDTESNYLTVAELYAYAEELGLRDTAEMAVLKAEVLPDMPTLDIDLRVISYGDLARVQMSSLSNEERPRAQIGLLVAGAAMYLQGGDFDGCFDQLVDIFSEENNWRAQPEDYNLILERIDDFARRVS